MTHATNTTAVACSGSAGTWGVKQQSDAGHTSVRTPAANVSDDGAASMGFTTSEQALGDVFYRQNPSAPPMSRGGSSTSWSIHRRKGSDLSSSSDLSQRNQWQDKLKPLPPPKEGRPLSIPAPLRVEPCKQRSRKQTEEDNSMYRTESVIKLHRPIMSRHCQDTLRVQATLDPRDAGVDGVGGCCGLCRAPALIPCFANILPCCAYPEELEEARRESTYLILRDNAIEFNNPKVAMGSRQAAARMSSLNTANGRGSGPRSRGGDYIGACGSTYHIRDDARVLYFDDPVLDDVVAITDPPCGELRRCLCGGRGQSVRVQRLVCGGSCVRTRGLTGLPCMPTCCMCLCRPVALSYDMPAKDAVDAAAKIAQARYNALARMRRDDDAHAAVPYDRS